MYILHIFHPTWMLSKAEGNKNKIKRKILQNLKEYGTWSIYLLSISLIRSHFNSRDSTIKFHFAIYFILLFSFPAFNISFAVCGPWNSNPFLVSKSYSLKNICNSIYICITQNFWSLLKMLYDEYVSFVSIDNPWHHMFCDWYF